jgi:hypothetical protein
MAIATQIIRPPIIVFVFGTSLIPRIGNQAQNIPPTTSKRESIVSSPESNCFEPILKSIRPEATIHP